MGFLLLLVCFVNVSLSSAGLDSDCPRKELPPGVVVAVPGSRVHLTCSGDVRVDGIRVNFTRNWPATKKNMLVQDITSNTGESLNHSDENSSKSRAGEGPSSNSTERVVRTEDPEHTKDESDQSDAEMDFKVGHGEEEEKGGSRSIQSSPIWRWMKKPLWKEDKQRISYGNTLELESVGITDSGNYTCLHRDRDEFSVKLIIMDPPERPTIFCYKKFPSSKILCEWTPQRPVVTPPSCHLLLNKSPSVRLNFTHLPCSYSVQHSRCWCAVDFNDDDQRSPYMAFLCVTTFTGNAISDLLHFTPLDILKPDPPSNVLVLPEEGQPTAIKVRWNLPTSWKQDSHYELEYEIKYRPLISSPEYEQTTTIKGWRRHIIVDAIPGVEYVIHLRAKDEYDGLWSEWSSPVYGKSWTAITDVQTTAVFNLTDYTEGSGSGADTDALELVQDLPMTSHLFVGISAFFALLLIILVIYILRHKDRFMSKLYSPSVITQRDALSAPVPTEGQALVTFTPMCCQQHTANHCEEREEMEDEAMHFNNASYFFLQS
ncbi:interleukin-6 receptor subunit alpha [Gouania willdenowi]|uniref:Interleukin-6 receptor subunit alpha-like n=1 Tax=Gouania willdenowi TaxID=441366 RepID=A0A8C5GD75_GOUWI|nr:interleukin-6 receptor subunit alpha-like [Gouania willdenowi]